MIHRILLGYDGSSDAQNAFAFALELARKFAAELHVVAVVQPPDFGGDVETEAVVESQRQHFDRALRALRTKLASETIKTHVEVIFGHAADRIVFYAEKIGADHIVIGHRGHTLIERWFLGSVARHVIDHARCAVTVVRRPGAR
jgi:nucleotide-binding universal stress UspA family protein